MTVDFRAFRIDGALAAGPHISAIEAVDRIAFKKFMADSNPQSALKSANHTLDLDYASAVAHYDAIMAYRALNQPDEATKHESLLNALLDSMAKVGDGKTLETSYLAATTQEEYIFMELRLNVKPTGQSLIIKNGYFYDLLKVVDPKTNAAQDLWFNADVQMNPEGNAVLNPVSATQNPAAPVVVATAQMIAPAPLTSNSPSPKGGASNSPPSVADAMENHPQSVSEAPAPTGPCAGPEGITSIPPKVYDALMLATKLLNPNEAGKKAVEIASQPGSGLKVASLLKDADGTIILYTIVVASAPKCAVATMVFHRDQQLHPQRILPASAAAGSWIDEFQTKSLANTYGIMYGINSSSDPANRGAVFTRANDSRIEYRNLPREGTLEWRILIKSGYHFENFLLHEGDPCAVLFSSDVSGGDVTWPGATRLTLCKNGDITLDMAEKKYVAPHQVIKAVNTSFRFGEWHTVGISYGNLGQAIWLDGAVVSHDGTFQQSLGAAGNHQQPVDVPTIGQTVSGFWAPHQYDGGFEGTVGRFRASSKQQDWLLSKTAPQDGNGTPVIVDQPSGVKTEKQTGQPTDAVAAGATINPEPPSGQAIKRYRPQDDGMWSRRMNIDITRTDAGNKYHFAVNFTVPDPPTGPPFPSPYLFNLVTVYGNQVQNGRVNFPGETIPSVEGNWKAGDHVHLEFDLSKEYADPMQGWNLRFCIGKRPNCLPSPNLLIDNSDAQKPRVEGPHIRVENRSGVDFKGVVVDGVQFGDIKAGSSTGYQVMEHAYKYARVTLSTDSGPLAIHPTDRLGEPRLKAGSYTYVLTVGDGGLGIECVVDSAVPASASLPAVSYLISTGGADLSIENGLGDPENASGVVYKVGGSVSPPILQQKVLANYSDEALKAKYQGVCLIEMIVDAQGQVQNPRVIRPLGMGLDEKALQAIRNWKFKPAMKDGKTPVPVMMTVEVDFHLYTPAQTIAPAQPSQNGPSPKGSASNSPPSVTDAMENHPQSVSEAPAPTGPCAGPEGIASVPPKDYSALILAAKLPNFHEAGKKAVEIASQPGSGLKVAYLLKDADGTIIQYTIVVASAPKCTVASMHLIREERFVPQPTNSGQDVKQYTPPEQGFWSHPMKINVTRMDAGSKYHFAVNFTVPDPSIRPNFPSSYPFNLISIYGGRVEGGRRIDIPQDLLPSVTGIWKPNDPVHLEFDLPKEYADPLQGWNLRFCIGSSSGCMSSSNLLVDNSNAPKPAAGGTDRSDGSDGSSPGGNLGGSNTSLTSGAGLGFSAGDGIWSGDDQSADARIYNVGGNISAPVVLKSMEAKFSDEARRAKYQGVCVISLIVDAQGKPQNAKVIRPVGMGLDANALEAVRKYKFKPAMKNGKTPVPVIITVEVDFHLYTPAQ